MNDGPELAKFEFSRYTCTNCKWFRSKPYHNWADRNITECHHPVFNKGIFSGYSLGGSNITPIGICPVLRKEKEDD